MTPAQTAELTCSKLEEKGYRGAVVHIEHIAQLKHQIEENVSQGNIDSGLHEKYMTYFRFDFANTLPGACSIVITAAPQPQRIVTFSFGGQTYPVIIPPTYYRDTDTPLSEILENILTSSGYRFRVIALPLKLLAVSSGMAKYGKNNIAYVEDLGSFVRLKAFLTDMPSGSSVWSEPRAMKECDGCKACLNECPTKLIIPDRFLIHAERCLTFFNEDAAAFPEWIEPVWHNSLIGCMKCQLACPVNKRFIKWVEEDEDFDEAETQLILSGLPIDSLPTETVRKLNRCYMTEYLDVLPRNLQALMK